MDLYGPLSITNKANSYIWTDLFSKLAYNVPLPNCDSLTVVNALFDMVCIFCVFDTLVSDRDSDTLQSVLSELWNLLEICQCHYDIYHYLGACKRTHRTRAVRYKTYLDRLKPAYVRADYFLPDVHKSNRAQTDHVSEPNISSSDPASEHAINATWIPYEQLNAHSR